MIDSIRWFNTSRLSAKCGYWNIESPIDNHQHQNDNKKIGEIMLKYLFSILMAISLNAFCQTIEEINKARLEKRFEDAFAMTRSLAETGRSQI